MTMPDSKDFEQDPFLDAFFDAGRAAAPQPSDDLMARVLADAGAVQAGAAAAAGTRAGVTAGAMTARARPRRVGPLALLLAALGGWPAVAGLASAAVAGVWVGVAQPNMATYVGLGTTVDTVADTTGYDLSDIGVDGLVMAGEF